MGTGTYLMYTVGSLDVMGGYPLRYTRHVYSSTVRSWIGAPLYYKWSMCSVRSLSTGACPWQRGAAPKAEDGARKLRFKKYHNGRIIGHHTHRHPKSYSIVIARKSQ